MAVGCAPCKDARDAAAERAEREGRSRVVLGAAVGGDRALDSVVAAEEDAERTCRCINLQSQVKPLQPWGKIILLNIDKIILSSMRNHIWSVSTYGPKWL